MKYHRVCHASSKIDVSASLCRVMSVFVRHRRSMTTLKHILHIFGVTSRPKVNFSRASFGPPCAFQWAFQICQVKFH